MLYKNLPEERLGKVMFIRFWLDILAMLMTQFSGEAQGLADLQPQRSNALVRIIAKRCFMMSAGWLLCRVL